MNQIKLSNIISIFESNGFNDIHFILFNFWQFLTFFLFLLAGAFMIIYLLMVFIIGLPIFFAELFVGQYSGLGPTKAYTYIAPLFQGETEVFVL